MILVTQMLLNFNNDQLGKELHDVYVSFLSSIEKGKSEIWTRKVPDETLGMVFILISDNLYVICKIFLKIKEKFVCFHFTYLQL